MAQQWSISPYPYDQKGVYIRYSNSGSYEFKNALERIPPGKVLRRINIGRLINLEVREFQNDILIFLKNHHPLE